MSCLPGINCGGYQSNDCHHEVNSNCVEYSGPNLPQSGIQTHDCLTLAIEKIDNKLDPTALAQSILTAIANNVQLKSILCNILSECP
jgi:hypothetical protein